MTPESWRWVQVCNSSPTCGQFKMRSSLPKQETLSVSTSPVPSPKAALPTATAPIYLIILSEYRSLAKEGPLWIVCPSSSFALISYWGLKFIWKSTHLAQALQIGISHCLHSKPEDVVRLDYTYYNNVMQITLLYSWYKVLRRCHARFEHILANNIDSLNVAPPPNLNPR